MTIDDLLNVTTEFTNRLQLPESKYKFTVTSNSEMIEIIIAIDENVKMSIKVTNGNINVLYTDEYNSDKYVALEFQTPITYLYQLSILFYVAVKEVIQLDFNEMLSVVLLEDIYDWKTLLYALAENLSFNVQIVDDKYVDVEGVQIHYSGFENKIWIDNTEIALDNPEYTHIVEAMFKCIEYIANVMGVADTFFNVQSPEEEITEEDNVSEEGGMPAGDMDINVDMEMPEENEPAPVETVENETFEEPQGPVVTMDDLI